MGTAAHHRGTFASAAAARRRALAATGDGWTSLPEWLVVGALVVDTATGSKGEVQLVGEPYCASAPIRAWVRPVGGGREWTPKIVDLRPLESEDES